MEDEQDRQQIAGYIERLFDDFEFFLVELWSAVSLPEPAAHQRDIADWLQRGPKKRGIRAFRNASKTWVTVAYCLWRLFRQANERVVLVSKTEGHARESVHMMRQWIRKVAWLRFLEPDRKGKHQRDSRLWFDVGPSREDRTPSVRASGIGGQLTGGRATIIVGDDVETPQNTLTIEMREWLREQVKEFENMLNPGGDIIYLGTPHHEDSLYPKLEKDGYIFRDWPARYPTDDLRPRSLSPGMARRMEMGWAKAGDPAWPERFPHDDLRDREAKLGRSTWLMQWMLQTGRDGQKYPLQMRDLIVFDAVPRDRAPVDVMWGVRSGDGRATRCEDIPFAGFDGDGLYRPVLYANETAAYQGTKMYVDPSGRGEDKTAYAITSLLNGRIWVKAVGGDAGGYGPEVLQKLAEVARMHGVNEIIAEDNFGQGMFASLMEPVVARMFIEPGDDDLYPAGWKCAISTERVSGQKEVRIIESIEPALGQHRLIVAHDVAANMDLQRQFTRITRERNCLGHEDELDALAGAIRCWSDRLHVDTEKAAERAKERIEEETRKTYFREMAGVDSPAAGGARWFRRQ